MPLRLECPICEYQFEIAREPSLTISTCPECNRSFKTSAAIVTTEEKPKRDKLILPEQVLASPALPTHTTQHDPGDVDDDPRPREAVNPGTGVPLKPMKRAYAKQPGKAVPLVFIAVLFAIAAGLLIYLPYVINQSNTPTDNSTSRKTDQGNVPTVSIPAKPDKTVVEWDEIRKATDRVTAGFAERQNGFDPAELDVPATNRNPKRPPEPNLEFFTEVQLEDCWREHHSRIIRLTVANSLGEKLALGTIVDSRGWMLTSYRAVAGATQIRVTKSASSFEQFKNEDPLSDLVRGVLAVDIENDLAILAINRRFVVNFSELKRSVEDTVASSDHLFQFGLIDEDTPLFVRETQVVGRTAFAELDPDVAKFFEDASLNSESTKWITHSNVQGIVGGAPLLNIEGELVGMCTELPAEKIGYAVPVAALDNLLKSIETDAKTDGGKTPLGLATLTERLEQIVQSNLNPSISVDVDSPFRDVSVQLNQIGKQCSQFGWVPKNLDQYELLQEFSQQLIEFNNTIYEIPDDPDLPDAATNLAHRETLQEQAKRWAAELKSSLALHPLPPNQVVDFNRVAAQAIRSANIDNSQTTYFISYVRVRLGAMDSPKPAAGVDTITLDVDQTEDIVIVPFDVRFPPMRPETLWLAIYSVSDTRKINFIDPDTDEKNQAVAGEIAMVLGPLE